MICTTKLLKGPPEGGFLVSFYGTIKLMSEILKQTNETIPNINTDATGKKIAEVYTEQGKELAEYAKDQIIYTGIFVDPEELYGKFPPSLSHRIRDPHVTVGYRPDASKMFLNALGSDAKIDIIGYGNDGQNEGVLVRVEAKDSGIQKTLNERVAPDQNGELKPVLMHITLSIAENAEAVNTRNLEFTELKEPVSISGSYKLFRKDGELIDKESTITEMKNAGFYATEEVEPDRL